MLYLSKTKRLSIRVFIAIFLFVQLFGVLSFAEPAYAQFAVTNPTQMTYQLSKDVKLSGWKALEASALAALMQGFSYFMRKMAHDAAMYVASGGKGKGALAFSKGPGEYFSTLAKDAAADAINAFGGPFGLNLCKTPDIRLQVFLQVSLRNLYDDKDGDGSGGGPQPSCTWQQFSNAWSPEAFEKKYGPGGSNYVADMFSNALRVDNTDFGIALGAMAKIDRIKAEAVQDGVTRRTEGNGFKPVESLISGKVKTPASVVQQETKALSASGQSEVTSGQIAGIYGAASLQVFPMAGSIFLNTLTSQLLQKLLKGGLFDSDSKDKADALDAYGGGGSQYSQLNKSPLSFLLTNFPYVRSSEYPLLTEFAACDADKNGLNNCVIDLNLQNLINIGSSGIGKALTIKEAMSSDNNFLLNPEWQLLPPSRAQDNTDKDPYNGCHTRAFCYSNIQKLRKARVFPLGFEIAVLKSDPDQPWTLGDVVDNFETCKRDSSGRAIVSSDYPFCHLIDPNWVVKIPALSCEAEVVGSILLDSNSPERTTECVDLSSQIIEDDNSTNRDYYSYCLKEENTWHINADSCTEPFNTCKTFFGQQGDVKSYLSRTLDYGECNSESVGCRSYSTENYDGSWYTSVNDYAEADWKNMKRAGRTFNLAFNVSLDNYDCDVQYNGCNSFYVAYKDLTTDNYVKIESSDSLAYLRKAPDYLGCYDTNFTGENDITINWPQTKVDLLDLEDRPEECADFAQVCVKSEVECEAYTSVADPDEPEIPGVIGQENECKDICVGYETFRQKETNFSPEEFPLYFIPGEADRCQLQYEGCDEFTNLEESARGGESLEYYSYIKYCEKPDGNNEKVYYSWEGSATEGYVLRTHYLLQVDDEDVSYMNNVTGLSFETELGTVTSSVSVFPVGSPMYANDRKEALEENFLNCNEENYNIYINTPGIAQIYSEDCRALYDKDGNVFYRILQDTVVVSDQCHPLRKTVSQLEPDNNLDSGTCEARGGLYQGGECLRCYNGGTYESGGTGQGGYCVYQAINVEGQSRSCPAYANGCRAYSGNEGGNVKEIKYFDFEPDDNSQDALAVVMSGWTGNGIIIKPEAIQVGKYSLRLSTKATYTFASSTIKNADWHEISFWARGDSGKIIDKVYLKQGGNSYSFTKDPGTEQDIKISLGNEWKQYKFGPVLFSGENTAPVELVFEGSGSGFIYLDSVRLSRLEGTHYLIKNSWKTPEGYDVDSTYCDTEPFDAYPGEALGCKAYKNSRGETENAIGFQKLCRPEAIGCTALYDTKNTNEVEATAYNVWCTGAGNIQNDKCTFVMGEENYPPCTVKPGADGCYIEGKVTVPDGVILPDQNITISTTIFPADTPSSTPIFLTYRDEFECPSSMLGCQEIALEEHVLKGSTEEGNYNYVERYVKNNPLNYDEMLCHNELIGCDEFRYNNEYHYFKDPKITGSSLCEYHPGTTGGSGVPGGWYMKEDVGRCEINIEYSCKEDSDCGEGDTCNPNILVPCYEDYYKPSEGIYDLWSSGSANYDNFVGVCEEKDNGCTELFDRADTSKINPEGKPYYVIYDEDLVDRSSDCEGRVSLKDGCVLFDRTEMPTKLWNTEKTIENSEDAEPKYSKIVPSVQDPLDANLILKVSRDRQCSEWLYCSDYMSVIKDNQEEQYCTSFGRCQKLDETDGTCADPVTAQEEDPVTYLSNRVFDETLYVSRDTSWYGDDFSGYSLFNRYNIADIDTILIEDNTNNTRQSFAVHEVKGSELLDDPTKGCVDRSVGTNIPKNDGITCGFDNKGKCFSGKCLYRISGGFSSQAVMTNFDDLDKYFEGEICKAFPEDSSPFPAALVTQSTQPLEAMVNPLLGMYVRYKLGFPKPEFNNANWCQTGDCSCSYKKIQYKNLDVDYWPLDNYDIKAPGVCGGGMVEDSNGRQLNAEGRPCKKDTDCGDGGTCYLAEKITQHIGQTGYCLEYDYSTPLPGVNNNFACLTWLPIDISGSGIDLFNTVPESGYLPVVDAVSSNEAESGGGEVYCLESIRNSAFWEKDTSRFPGSVSNMFSDVPGYYNDNFRDDGSPLGSNIDHSDFWHLNDSDLLNDRDGEPFGSVDSNGVAEGWPTFTYKMMSIWGWGTLGENAVVLRIEQPAEGCNAHVYETADDPTESMDTYSKQGVPPDSGYTYLSTPYRSVNGFAPDTADRISFGTIMHPPRNWSKSPVQVNYKYKQSNIKNSVDEEDREPPDGDGRWYISTVAMSPGPYLFDSNKFIDNDGNDGVGNYGWNGIMRMPVEGIIREADLQKVHFVPLTYPCGEEGINPLLLTDELYIDFTELRNQEGKQAVKYFSANENGDGGDSDHDYDPVPNGGRVWMYKLDRETTGLLSFDDYDVDIKGQIGNGAEMDSIMETAKNDDRNEIARRYVAFYGKNPPPYDSVVNTSGDGFPDEDHDPFSGLCIHDWQSAQLGSSESENWLAIGMDFNKDGEFLGYISRWCMATQNKKGESNGITFATIATLNNQCTKFAQVYDRNVNPTGNDSNNKAWTERTWLDNVTGSFLPNFGEISFDSSLPPFGSLSLNGSDIINNPANAVKMRNYSFLNTVYNQVNNLGLPYSMVGKYNGMNESNFTVLDSFPNMQVNGYEGSELPDSGIDPATANNSLNALFAKFYHQVNYNNTDAQFNPIFITSTPSVLDISGEGTGNNSGLHNMTKLFVQKPPRIFSLNPYTCKYGTAENPCTAAEMDAFTVNWRNYTMANYDDDPADRPDEDKDGDGEKDLVVDFGKFAANIRFFAYADDNHMPIKRVMVDWGDGEIGDNLGGISRTTGLYQNHKPFCASENQFSYSNEELGRCVDNTANNEMDTQITCKHTDDCKFIYPVSHPNMECEIPGVDRHFGDAPRACTPQPFNLTHYYECDEGLAVLNPQSSGGYGVQVKNLPSTSGNNIKAKISALISNEEKYDQDTWVCVYKPKVQVLDNWGWCTGDCETQYHDYEKGCYNKEGFGLGGNDKKCDATELDTPWVEYKGEIIVLPI